jgi:hypothetical protein
LLKTIDNVLLLFFNKIFNKISIVFIGFASKTRNNFSAFLFS